MQLFEISDLPKKAGKAVIHFDEAQSTPKRDGKDICLPKEPLARFFPIDDGKQFLYKGGEDRGCWFGGTDEEPFLVEMDSNAFDAFLQGARNFGNPLLREQAFYRSLVPSIVDKISAETGIAYRRQGDIFAARYCSDNYGFAKNLQALSRLSKRGKGIIEVEQSTESVFGTRHEGKGTFVHVKDEYHFSSAQLFTGTLNTPDHKPLSLDDGLYVLGQTRFIAQPQNAD